MGKRVGSDIASRIAEETRKRIVERDRYPEMMKPLSLAAIESDLADQIRSALADAERARRKTGASDEDSAK